MNSPAVRSAQLSCTLTLSLALISLADGAVLTGAGSHLPIPSPNLGNSTSAVSPAQFPQINSSSPSAFTGTWISPAKPAWIGTWAATGPLTNNISSGSTDFDFTALPQGHLPPSTYFRFGDVDAGSGSPEQFTLAAYADAAATIPLFSWLDEPVGVRTANGSGPSGSVVAVDMPRWSYNASTGEYLIDGSTVPANPNIAFVLTNNQPIVFLRVSKLTTPYQLDLMAPEIPEPQSAALAAFAAVTIAGANVTRGRKPPLVMA